MSAVQQQGYTKFGPDPALSTLPLEFQSCLPPNPPTVDCDMNIVGSLAHGAGYCAYPAYADTTYCACVNAPITSSQCYFAPCANSAYAYMTTKMKEQSGANCPQGIVCINIVDVGGSQNVVTGITQQCGIITNIVNAIQANPVLASIIFVLVLVFTVLITFPPTEHEDNYFANYRTEL